MSSRNPVGRFFSLSAKEKKLFAEMALLVLWADVLTLFPLRYYKRCIEHISSRKTENEEEFIRLVKKTLSRIRKYWFKEISCLAFSVATKKLLIRHGIPCILCIGLKKDNNRLSAHAWTYYKDIILTGYIPSESYTLIATL